MGCMRSGEAIRKGNGEVKWAMCGKVGNCNDDEKCDTQCRKQGYVDGMCTALLQCCCEE